jgi:hypothetical protein
MILDFLDDAFDQKGHFVKLDRGFRNIGLMFPNINNDGAIFEVFQRETILNTDQTALSPEFIGRRTVLILQVVFQVLLLKAFEVADILVESFLLLQNLVEELLDLFFDGAIMGKLSVVLLQKLRSCLELVDELGDLVSASYDVSGDLAVAHFIFDRVDFVLEVERLL